MKIILFLVIVSTLALLAQAGPTKSSNLARSCKSCSLDYLPVCAGPPTGTEKPKSFGSVCVLDNYNCEKKTQWVVKSQGECPGGGGVRLQ